MLKVQTELDLIVRIAVNERLLIGSSWSEIADEMGFPTATARSRWAIEQYPRGLLIYGLREMGDSVLRYVGKTSNVGARIQQHRQSATLGRTPVAQWINKITPYQLEIVILQLCDNENDLTAAERKWIDKARGDGHKLLNVALPSGVIVPRGPYKTDEQKLQEAQKRFEHRRESEDNAERHKREVNGRQGAIEAANSALWWERQLERNKARAAAEGLTLAEWTEKQKPKPPFPWGRPLVTRVRTGYAPPSS